MRDMAPRRTVLIGLFWTMAAMAACDFGDAASSGSSVAAGSGAAMPAICPKGSEALVLDLNGATPSQVPGTPPPDNYSPGFSVIEGPL